VAFGVQKSIDQEIFKVT